MNATYRLDRPAGTLFDGAGRSWDRQQRRWVAATTSAAGEAVDAIGALGWLQREGGRPIRTPVGVIGPREASAAQLAAAQAVGQGLAAMGLAVVCGGRHGVMEAVCRGVANGGLVELSWAPTFTGGAATGYALDVAGPVSGTVPLGATPLFAFPTVPDGAYTFSVRALNASGGSAASAPVALSFPGTCAVPGAPSAVTAAAQGGVIMILWDPPATGGAATNYTLTVTGSVSGAVSLGTARLFSSPAPPGSYTLRVTPVNNCGAGPASAPITVVVP
jgi:hypothetical protein